MAVGRCIIFGAMPQTKRFHNNIDDIAINILLNIINVVPVSSSSSRTFFGTYTPTFASDVFRFVCDSLYDQHDDYYIDEK